MPRKVSSRGRTGPSLLFLALAGGAWAAPAAADGWPDGFVYDARYRYGHIVRDGFDAAANANTLRVTLGYRLAFAGGWRAYLEGTRVSAPFGQHYDSGANGRTRLPQEGDPPSSEISAAWIGYEGAAADFRVGRQYVNLDDQRFFSSGLWRQNPQSFDGVAARWRAGDATTLRYFHLDRAHRSVGHDYPDPRQREWKLDADLLHAEQALPLGTLVGYDYRVGNSTEARNSSHTTGLRWTGARPLGPFTVEWAAERARQRGWRNNPRRFAAGYRLLEAAAGLPQAGLKLGEQRLGGGEVAFSSPYGSGHAFGGWAGQFRSVPAAGLLDRYAGAAGRRAGFAWSITQHRFSADRGGLRYGTETDASLRYAARGGFSVELDRAAYHRAGFGVSERDLWIMLEWRRGAPGGGD